MKRRLHVWGLVLAVGLLAGLGRLGAQTHSERGATGVAVLLNGRVAGVAVTDGGAGYLVAPPVGFSGGGGSGAGAYAQLTNGSVIQIVVTNGGTGYASAPAVTIGLPPRSLGMAITMAPLLRVEGEPGTVTLIQWASTVGNTNQWNTITSVVLGAVAFVWSDTDGTQAGRRFYRAVDQSTIPVVTTGMALIPAGDFTMGDSLDGGSSALPLHTVTVSAFYMDKCEVTKAVWDGVYDWAIANGYSFEYGARGKGANHPAQNMTWYDAVKWCNARSQREGKTPAYYTDVGMTVVYKSGQVAPHVRWDQGYRLPTEAEWEKAARGGANGQRFPWGDTITHGQANFYSDAGIACDTSATRGYHPGYNDGVFPFTSPVGAFSANAHGLYDLTGNVWEWCWDWYEGYGGAPEADPRGPASGWGRVIRGGSWGSNALNGRSANRNGDYPSYGNDGLGFRSVLPPNQP